jgi:hypothetical protein
MSYAPNQPLAAVGVPAAGGSAPLSQRLAATPRLACEALAKALNAGELEAALACFSPGGGLVWEDGTLTRGEAALRDRLAELIARAARVGIELYGVLVAADIALAHERWQVTYANGVDASAAPASAPTLVLRLIAGEWRIAIAAPWGVPQSAPLRAIWP